MLSCRYEIVVEKVTKDDSEMVGKAARRDVVFYYFSKLLERTLSRFVLEYRMVTCTSLWRTRSDSVSCDRSLHSSSRYNVIHYQVVKDLLRVHRSLKCRPKRCQRG